MVGGFKVYTDGNRECFEWRADKGKKPVKMEFPFAQSLLDFLDLDMDGCFDVFNGMGKIVQELQGGNFENIAALRSALDGVAAMHVYFQLLRLEWLAKLDDYENGRCDGSVYDFIPHKALTHIPMNVINAQHQARYMVEKAMSAPDNSEDPVAVRVAGLYGGKKAERSKAFEFQPLVVGFECVGGFGMVEVLYPDSIFDIVGFFLREAIRRGIGFKTCQNCGRYFPDTAHGNTEFCSRPFLDSGKTCKETGSLTKWREKAAASPAILLYNKHYKTRFSRIKAGKVTCGAFREWAATAREYRDRVMAGEMPLEAFEEWLGTGSWV
jgi:hypothetical protein